ncbi:MAG: hypothetical protein IPI84_14700 [Holophagaceae bacterium]|nr:hypothetical protein [Holophagaceae bacterium]
MVLTIQAPAKLNRFLAVLGRRADGFHELELVTTVLEGVPGLTDLLSGEPAASLSLEISGPAGHGLTADASNLVLRAWRQLERVADRPLPARLQLEKHVPHGAGLGGGSSDAAAALRLGNRLFDLGLEDQALLILASELGSDVPLFLLGGTVLGLDRGERVFPLRPYPWNRCSSRIRACTSAPRPCTGPCRRSGTRSPSRCPPCRPAPRPPGATT